jgi:hypothetical protein
MEQNIFQVIEEKHIDEILTDHTQNLSIIMYSVSAPEYKKLKSTFVKLSKKYSHIFFIYIDKNNFQMTSQKYFAPETKVPYFQFFIGGNKIAFIEGGSEQILEKTVFELNFKVEEKKKEYHQRERIIAQEKVIQHDELIRKKIDLLNKSRELGIPMHFNLESNYEDILAVYQYHTNPQFKQYILNQLQQSDQEQESEHSKEQIANNNTQNVETKQTSEPQLSSEELEALKKQQKIKQIEELNIINQRIQMQNLQKLQQLKKIQLMKEQQEKKDFEKND